jgi:hypothetical protein
LSIYYTKQTEGETKMPINPVAQTDATKVAVQAVAANANQTQPEAPKPAPAKPQPTTDTVQISGSAKALMQEAQETPAQTAQEAGRGDRQALRLLAKENVAKAALLGNKQSSPLSPK